MTENKIASLVYNILLNQSLSNNNRHYRQLWKRLWDLACRHFSCPVSTSIHGRKAFVNFGHSYPLYARRFRNWNDPLLELVYRSFRAKNRRVVVTDVGAGIGDTVLLIEGNCGGMVEQFFCVEGDAEFFSYLVENTRQLDKVHTHLAMLSDKDDEEISSLIRTHPGTASAQGTQKVSSTTLDSILSRAGHPNIDVLKIDVDGYDGKVLLGASNLLKHHMPSVIFEWHPIMCRQAGTNCVQHFQILCERGYDRFVWFTKYGHFSHFMEGFDVKIVRRLEELCLRGHYDDDWHYDVIALHASDAIIDIELAELSFAKARQSWY